MVKCSRCFFLFPSLSETSGARHLVNIQLHLGSHCFLLFTIRDFWIFKFDHVCFSMNQPWYVSMQCSTSIYYHNYAVIEAAALRVLLLSSRDGRGVFLACCPTDGTCWTCWTCWTMYAEFPVFYAHTFTVLVKGLQGKLCNHNNVHASRKIHFDRRILEWSSCAIQVLSSFSLPVSSGMFQDQNIG